RSFIPCYEERLVGIEKEVYYFKKGKKYTGRIKGINEKGQLLIKNKRDDLEKLIASEIHFSSQQFT
ncbi:MAG: hypothetical protein L0I79_04485, partial [Atopostipes sp.]|nr:hypothetical protein [Atopostipes sp.]